MAMKVCMCLNVFVWTHVNGPPPLINTIVFEGLPIWIYEELRSINAVAHKYSDEESPEDIVETFAEEMAPQYCLPPARLLAGSDLLFEYRPELIQVREDDEISLRIDRRDSSIVVQVYMCLNVFVWTHINGPPSS